MEGPTSYLGYECKLLWIKVIREGECGDGCSGGKSTLIKTTMLHLLWGADPLTSGVVLGVCGQNEHTYFFSSYH